LLLRRLPAVYLVVVVIVAGSRAATGRPTVRSLALTPDRLEARKLWLLATSAVIVDGPVLPQLAGLVPSVILAERRFGGESTAAVMVVAHVGATLLAYVTLRVFTGDADGPHNRSLDYGVSAVWLGTLGALSEASLPGARRRERPALAVVALGVVAFGGGVACFPLLSATEHGFAFALGALARPAGARLRATIGRLTRVGPRGVEPRSRRPRG
jgi:hypothetical protein